MKKALYTFLLWDLFLFATGLNDLVFYRNVTLSESATVVDWAQPAFASVTLFLILLSIYYGLHLLLFGKNFYLKLEVKQEDIDKMRDFIFILLKKEKIDPDKLHQHLKYLIIAEVVLWCIFIIYLFVSRSTAI
jgi:quaternary ammonium compound-resistance protein SugE